jgi:hypothetical protein
VTFLALPWLIWVVMSTGETLVAGPVEYLIALGSG